MEKDIFLFFINNIFHICLVTVHADMMKKLERNTLQPELSSICQSVRNMNIKQSERKRSLTSEDILNKTDVHLLFIESINVKYFFFILIINI